MKKNVFLIFLVCFACITFLLVSPSCKSPSSPEPIKTSDILEFMYERVLPIIFPEYPDPDGFTIFNDDGGGRNPHNWHKIAENKWMAEDELKYTGSQYMIWLNDPKVTGVYVPIARKISARIKGQEWIELTCIKPNLFEDGEQAEFILDAKGIHTIF
jgi:hypothetical protein